MGHYFGVRFRVTAQIKQLKHEREPKWLWLKGKVLLSGFFCSVCCPKRADFSHLETHLLHWPPTVVLKACLPHWSCASAYLDSRNSTDKRLADTEIVSKSSCLFQLNQIIDCVFILLVKTGAVQLVLLLSGGGAFLHWSVLSALAPTCAPWDSGTGQQTHNLLGHHLGLEV